MPPTNPIGIGQGPQIPPTGNNLEKIDKSVGLLKNYSTSPYGRINTQARIKKREEAEALRRREKEQQIAAQAATNAETMAKMVRKSEENANKANRNSKAKANMNARYPAAYELADTLIKIPLTYLPIPTFFSRSVPAITQTYKTIMSSLRNILTKELQKENITNSDAMIRNVKSICFQEFLKLTLPQMKSGPAPEFSTDPSVADSKLLNIATAMMVGIIPHLRDNIQFIGSTPVGFKEAYDITRFQKCDQELKKNKAGISPQVIEINRLLQRFFELNEIVSHIKQTVESIGLTDQQKQVLVGELNQLLVQIESIENPNAQHMGSSSASNTAIEEQNFPTWAGGQPRKRTTRRKKSQRSVRDRHVSRRRRRTQRLL
jgi:hypothetical protein